MKILFLGPPGAGKGTQATLVHEEKQFPLLTMGDMLRQAVKRGDEVGKQAESFMSKGALVPDEVVTKVILQCLSPENGLEKSFILDGYPRNLSQAHALDEHLTKQNMPLDIVLFFSVPDEIVKQRIMGREDGRPEDQDPNVTAKRLEEYKQKTLPLVDFYKQKNILKEIDANRSKEEVFATTISLLQ
ncbi:adenylate kinase [Candidatus Uabimicrobium sp. HlEnr_7]|uniref:adenylate kinase n=1 Tax=Candidatus Uabimicrobium helgolandensis TaxID=3095367 RepID=UPI0035562855